LVNKGPDPIGTLELAMASGGVCVRGNHDEAAVSLRRRIDEEEYGEATLHRPPSSSAAPAAAAAGAAAAAAAAAATAATEEREKKQDKKKDKDRGKGKGRERDGTKRAAPLLPIPELLKHMPWVADPRAARGLRWLGATPFSLRVASRELTVVHAGLVPSPPPSPSSSSEASASSPAAAAAAAAATSVESQKLEDLLEVRHVAREVSRAAVAAGGGEAAAAAPASSSAAVAASPESRPPPGRWRAIDKKLAKKAEREGAHASGLAVSLWAKEYRAAAGAFEEEGGGDGAGAGAGVVGAAGGKLPSLPPPRSAGHVVFGHHASLGLQQELSATGIDTGCVLGGELTALVLGPVVFPPSGGGGGDEGSQKTKKASPSPSRSPSSSSGAGWKNLPGRAKLVSVKARRAYVGKDAADAGAEEC
jgi:hypothetical protein